MRLGRQQGLDGEHRDGIGRGAVRGRARGAVPAAVAAVAALAIIASVVVADGPPASADRSRSRDRGRSTHQPYGEAGPADGMPARFVAASGGRIAIVSVDAGRVERYLTADQPGGGAEEPTVSPDGRTVWFSRGDGSCAAHLASVAVAGGDEQKVPGSGEAGPEGMPLPRPGKAQLAYSRSGCENPEEALVVGDLRGLEGHGQVGLVPLAWSRDGNHLLAVTSDGAEVHLLRVNQAGAIVDDEALAPVDRTPECRLEVVGFSPDNNDGYVALRRCGPAGGQARRSLVLLDRSGAVRGAVLRLPRGQDFVDRPAFDTTGHSLLYSTAPADAGSGGAGPPGDQLSLWLWRDGESRLLARDGRYRHPSWLP